AFLGWSARSGKFNPAACDERWSHWHTSPPDRLTAGTIFFEAGPDPHDERRRNAPRDAEPPPPRGESDYRRTSGSNGSGSASEDKGPRPLIKATPFIWTPPEKLPRRRFIYGRNYVRKFISVDASPGGVGKTSLGIVEGLAIISGRDLLGVMPK